MIDPNNFYFYIIFIIQILLASWYIPNKILIRMKKVMETYPPSEYPKLYSGNVTAYKKTQNTYRIINSALFTIGFCFLSAIVMWDYSNQNQISPMIPWVYFMLQMIPLMWLEIKEFKNFKIMRNNNSNSKKTATITPRKLFNFLSEKLFYGAIIAVVIAFSLVLTRYGFSSKSFQNIIVILATNLFFAGLIYWNIYGKKQDPYQSDEDREKIIKVTVKSLAYISIGVSIFLSIQMLIKIYDLSFLKASVMSIYCQLILWASVGNRLKELNIDCIDFSVYKDNNKESEIKGA
ncbi:MAG: hypothetical protein AB8B80_03050 [Marinicellaceae bacterium]